MRVGKNPYKYKTGKFTPAKIGIASLCYIPFLEGFYESSLDVLKVHLESLQLTKIEDCNVMVFDNGSCQEVIDFLEKERQRGVIDWLVLSKHNMSKVGAINWAFSVLENEYLAFTDSDVLFRSGWMEESLAIFEHFDKAGIVAAQPPFYDLLKEEFMSPESIRKDGRYEIEEMVPEKRWAAEYCRGMGLPEEEYDYYETRPLFRVRPQSGEGEAWVGASHQQFIMPRKLAKEILPLPVSGKLMPADIREVNRRPETLGYWQLSTIDAYYYHMGNTLNDQVLQEIASLQEGKTSANVAMHQQALSETAKSTKGVIYKLLIWLMRKIPQLRNLFTRIYGFLFRLVEE